mmetsp:Transcript_9317/g.28013  ORF Transcript_9317/g.28013 Transcript_9317/m.28013 type:complete len:302 (+) Transcript_9317:429-1334(+)
MLSQNRTTILVKALQNFQCLDSQEFNGITRPIKKLRQLRPNPCIPNASFAHHPICPMPIVKQAWPIRSCDSRFLQVSGHRPSSPFRHGSSYACCRARCYRWLRCLQRCRCRLSRCSYCSVRRQGGRRGPLRHLAQAAPRRAAVPSLPCSPLALRTLALWDPLRQRRRRRARRGRHARRVPGRSHRSPLNPCASSGHGPWVNHPHPEGRASSRAVPAAGWWQVAPRQPQPLPPPPACHPPPRATSCPGDPPAVRGPLSSQSVEACESPHWSLASAQTPRCALTLSSSAPPWEGRLEVHLAPV